MAVNLSKIKLTEQTKEKIEEVHEGLQNLKKRTNFDILKSKERLWEIETGINNYREHNDIEGIRHALGIWRETSGPATEGASAYDETIWDANVQVRGKMTILDSLFNDLQDLIEEYYK